MSFSPWSSLTLIARGAGIVQLALLLLILVLGASGFSREFRGRGLTADAARSRWQWIAPRTLVGLGVLALLLSALHATMAHGFAFDILANLGERPDVNLDAQFCATALGVGTAFVGLATGLCLQWMADGRRIRNARSRTGGKR